MPRGPALDPPGEGHSHSDQAAGLAADPGSPAQSNLRRLHDVIQGTMGWTQSHLYEFELGRVTFGEPSLEE